MFGSSVANYIIAARTTQGYEESKNATKEERIDIINRWRLHKDEYQSSKMKIHESGGPEGQESGRLTPKGFMQTRHLDFDERKKLHEERKSRREAERRRLEAEQSTHGGHRYCPFCRRPEAHTHEPRASQTQAVVSPTAGDDDHFEHAIHASVAATSRGNVEEDMMIERAIRASIRELQSSQGSTLTDEEALNRAIHASIAEAGRRRSDEQNPAIAMTDEEAEHQAALEKAIQASLAKYQLSAPRDQVVDDPDTDEDENIKIAIEMSKADMSKEEATRLEDEQKEIEQALEKSKKDLVKTKTEEDIVLDYVRKQSLLEEEHKKGVEGKRVEPTPIPVPTPASTFASTAPSTIGGASAETASIAETASMTTNEDYMSPADEEALKKAIEESMKASGSG